MCKKKILLVTFSDNADHQDTVFGIYEQLSQSEDVYLLGIKNPKVEVVRNDKVWLIDCPECPGICKKTFNLKLLFSTIRKIQKERFDVIYFESLHVWNLPILCCCGKKTTTYQVIHEVIPHEGDKQEKLVDIMNTVVCKVADVIVLRNQMFMQDMIERYRIDASRVKSLELWRRYPDYTEPCYKKRVLFFGRINPYKGVDNLLEIVRSCPEIQFDVIGRVDSQMQTLVDELKRENNVMVNSEYVSDEEMKKAFVNADVVIVPYNSASQSGIIIDAYKYSRPVVAFNVGAISEQVENGVSGYLVEEGDNKGFVKKIRELLVLPEESYEKLCKQAYEYGSQKYSVKGATKRFMDLLNGEGV